MPSITPEGCLLCIGRFVYNMFRSIGAIFRCIYIYIYIKITNNTPQLPLNINRLIVKRDVFYTETTHKTVTLLSNFEICIT